jgi:hypothetical protein
MKLLFNKPSQGRTKMANETATISTVLGMYTSDYGSARIFRFPNTQAPIRSAASAWRRGNSGGSAQRDAAWTAKQHVDGPKSTQHGDDATRIECSRKGYGGEAQRRRTMAAQLKGDESPPQYRAIQLDFVQKITPDQNALIPC